MLTHGFFGYMIAFVAILLGSFIFLFGLSYWGAQSGSETTCVTSSGAEC